MSDDRSARHEHKSEAERSAEAGRSADAGRDDAPGSADASWMSDRTEQMPRTPREPTAGDATEVLPLADDATRVVPVDRTAMLPNVDESHAGRSAAAARAAAGRAAPDWDIRMESGRAGRAEVRSSRPGAGGDFTRTDWPPVESQPRRVWWSPILIGVVALLLVTLLGVGVWLIVQSMSDPEKVAPVVTPSVVAPVTTTPSAAPAPTATTAPTPPPTTAPTTPPTSGPAEPQEVPIPALKGLSSADARQALDRVGLTYRLIFRSADAELGTVIDSDPPEGREVPPDTQVTLVVATSRSTPPAVKASPPPTANASATVPGADAPEE